MNGRHQIARSLREANLEDRFGHIVGWEDVDIRRQKPEPDGLLDCIDELTGSAEGVVMYLGDHETDIRCATNAQAVLSGRGRDVRVVPVGVAFSGDRDFSAWQPPPAFAIRHPHEAMHVARELIDGRR